MPFVMKQAQKCDLDTVMALLNDRVGWLRQKGSDQWCTSPTFRVRLAKSISLQETWLLLDNDIVIGTYSISTFGDPEFWTPSELQEHAVYLS